MPAKKQVIQQSIEPPVLPPAENTDSSHVEEKDFEVVETKDNYPLTLHDDLKQWIEVNGFMEESKKVTLYKFDNAKAGDRKQYCDSWEDTLPDLSEIGMRFGGGRYMLYVNIQSDTIKQGTTRSYKFRIHEQYDKLQREQHHVMPVNSSIDSAQSFQNMVSMFKELVVCMAPLFRPSEVQVQNQVQQAKLLQEVIKESTMSSIQFANDLMKKTISDETELNDEAEDDPAEDRPPSLLETLMPLVDKYLPMILGDKPESKVVGNLVKSAPQFKQIIKNRTQLKSLLTYISKKYGDKECEQACKVLGIKK